MKHFYLLIAFLIPIVSTAQPTFSWERSSVLNIDRRQCASICVIGSNVLIHGGFNGTSVDRSSYELKQNGLSRIDLKYPGDGFMDNILFYGDSVLYVGGGRETQHDHYAQKDFWKYDYRRRQWHRLNKLPFEYQRAAHIHQLPDGTPYAVVEIKIEKRIQPITCIYKYSIAEDKWVYESSCPNPELLGLQTFVIDEQLYAFFESVTWGNWFSGELLKYDFSNQHWSFLARFPFSKRMSCFAFSDGKYGFVGGGVNDQELDDVYFYDPVRNEWKFANTLECGISGASTWSIGSAYYLGMGVQVPQGPNYFWRLKRTD